MQYNGWAFRENQTELRDEVSNRYKEIQHLRGVLELQVTPCYAHNVFKGTLLTPEVKALSAFDLLILADMGNLCFGGNCSKNDNTFSGSYNTD